VKHTNPQPLKWTRPKKNLKICHLKPGQSCLDFNLILSGRAADIDAVLDSLAPSFLDTDPENVLTIRLEALSGSDAHREVEIRLYDLIGEESETAVWNAVYQVYRQAAISKKIVFADPNFVTGDPGPGGGSGGVNGGTTGNIGPDTPEEAFIKHWAFGERNAVQRGIRLEDGRGRRLVEHKGAGVKVILFDSYDSDIPRDLDRAQNPAQSAAQGWIEIRRGFPPEPLRLLVSSPDFQPSGIKVVSHPAFDCVDEHGFYVAGLVHRLAPQSDIHLVDVLNEKSQGELFGLLQSLYQLGVQAAEQAGDDRPLQDTVINLSLGASFSETMLLRSKTRDAIKDLYDAVVGSNVQAPPFLSQLLADMVEHFHYVPSLRMVLQALHTLGAVVVAAAGNDSGQHYGVEPAQIPARYPEVIGVAASTQHGQLACFSNQGEVLAPGGGTPDDVCPPVDFTTDCRDVAMISLVPRVKPYMSGYAFWQGTSFAAPIVSGLAALVIEKHKRKFGHAPTPEQVKEYICQNTQDGIVDVQNTLSAI